MASQTTGYQGFRSFSVQSCPTLKPGETYEARTTKFSKMGSHIITSPQQNRLGRHVFESVASQSSQNVQPSDYHVPDKRGVIANEKPPIQHRFIATSTYLHDFPSYAAELRHVVDTPFETYERAFQAVLSESRDGNNNTIDLSHVSKVVILALGEHAVARVIESFVTYFDHDRSITSDKITWDVFQGAIFHIHTLFQNDLGKVPKRLTAPSTTLSKQETVKVIPATTPASSHQVDYGHYGDQPLERPYIRRRGMASTTDDLQPGTHKTTMHIPGYTGFLPRTIHNPDAVNHGSGENQRGRKDELRLYHTDNVPGYTGHKPVDCKNYRGECRAGSSSMTSTGAAYKPHM